MTHSFSLALMQPSPGGGGGMSMQGILFQIAMFVAIFYFFLIRPQQKQRKQQEQMLLALKKGDDIVTAGGVVAQVLHIQQKVVEGATAPSLDDLITIRSGESKLVVERGKIARVMPKGAEAPASA
jgi:preprotein translocase subunit YajC